MRSFPVLKVGEMVLLRTFQCSSRALFSIDNTYLPFATEDCSKIKKKAIELHS